MEGWRCVYEGVYVLNDSDYLPTTIPLMGINQIIAGCRVSIFPVKNNEHVAMLMFYKHFLNRHFATFTTILSIVFKCS